MTKTRKETFEETALFAHSCVLLGSANAFWVLCDRSDWISARRDLYDARPGERTASNCNQPGDASHVSDGIQYIGMDIHAALALAHKNGDQLRVLRNGTIQLRYASPPEDHEIQVEVKDGIVSRVL